ncbi:MAG: ComF family protein [Sedimentisphaerales bacterium]|nr:ComF family protein [Sedimentisphaerales bacterium]
MSPSNGLIGLIRGLGSGILEIAAPSRCAGCQKPIDDQTDTLCAACWEDLRESLTAAYCPTCGRDSGPYAIIDSRCQRCRQKRPRITQVVRVGPYGGVLRRLILDLKFGRRTELDAFLGRLLAEAILGNPLFTDVDWLVPVPLHWRRRWVRRYNQAELLARAAAAELNRQDRHVRVNADLLRIRYTPPQTSLSFNQRRLNLHRAFAARPDARFAGRHICLIDDVTTTGATLNAAAWACSKLGPRKISAAVVAVAAND